MITEETRKVSRFTAYCDGYCGQTVTAESRADLLAEMSERGWYKTSRWNGFEYVIRHYCAECIEKVEPDPAVAIYPA